MRGLGFLLFVVAIQVIAALIQHRKKQQEKKAKEEATRQRSLRQLGLPTGDSGGVAVPTAAQEQASSSGDLEERRRAQLEQLRQRREGRRTGIATSKTGAPTQPTLRRGVAIQTQQPQRNQPVTVATTIGTTDAARSRAQEATRLAREAERARRDQVGRLAAQTQDAEDAAARKVYEQTFHAVAGEADAVAHGVKRSISPTAVAASMGATKVRGGVEGSGAVAAAMAKRLRDHASLRELIVLREILDKPVGLR